MKITKIIALLLISILTFSCSSDDDGDGGNTSIDGTWKMTAFLSENAYDLNGDGTSSNNIIVETNCYQNELIVLNSDGTGNVVSSSYLDTLLELVVGTTDEYEYSIDCVLEDDTFNLEWSQEGNVVTFFDNGVEVEVATLSGNTLTLVQPSGFDVEVIDDNGVIVEVTEDLTIIYTKQ